MGNVPSTNLIYILTQRINQILLLITLIYVLTNKNVKYELIQILGIFNLIIGIIDYLLMLYFPNPNDRSAFSYEGLRYLDWLITTPINTYVYGIILL